MLQYLPLFLFIIIALIVASVPLLIGACLGPRRPNPQKSAPYECGFEPLHDARIRFDVRFYLIGILFIIFDLEMIFLFPFAVSFRQIPDSGLIAMGFFLGLLALGFVVEWKKGALEWSKAS